MKNRSGSLKKEDAIAEFEMVLSGKFGFSFDLAFFEGNVCKTAVFDKFFKDY